MNRKCESITSICGLNNFGTQSALTVPPASFLFVNAAFPLSAQLKEVAEIKRPLTRALLEEKIARAQLSLDSALERKAYAECGPLQAEIECLKGKRSQLPTIDELRQVLSNIETEIAVFIESRNFVAAAEGQTRIDEAKRKLEDAIVAEKIEPEIGDDDANYRQVNLFNSRTELEMELSDLSMKIKSAIDSKDFKLASELQVSFEQTEVLRKEYPTLTELQSKLLEARTNLQTAVLEKNFVLADGLSEEIMILEAKVSNEEACASTRTDLAIESTAVALPDGSEKVFESRVDLEREIHEAVIEVANAVSAKSFKIAQSLQLYVDSLEALRHKLPSIEDIQGTLREKRKLLDSKIAQKDFVGAELLNDDITILECKLAGELAKRAQSAPKPIEGHAPSIHSEPLVGYGRQGPVIPQNTVSEGILPRRVGAIPPTLVKARGGYRQVSKLRPLKPVLVQSDSTIVDVCKLLSSKRARAAILTGKSSGVAGIITDSDITRRVVAKNLDPASTAVTTVMTPNPVCVSMADSAIDALAMMIENRYRHLPVVDKNNQVCGLLDIGKCLNDAISKLEHAESKSGNAAQDALNQVVRLQGGNGANAAILQALLGPLMAQALGDKSSPSLRSVLAGKPSTVVRPSCTVLEAAERMAENRKAALIVEGGKLVGILSFKDVMSRVIAKELSLSETPVSDVMTPNPESMLPDATVLEALQVMHDNDFLTLPVCESDGRVVGLVDVMDVIYGCGGAEGWRSIFNSAVEIDDAGSAASEEHDLPSDLRGASLAAFARNSPVKTAQEPIFASVLGSIPRTVEIDVTENSFDFSERASVFKVLDQNGNNHRIRADVKLDSIFDSLLPKLGKGIGPDDVTIHFLDNEGDAVLITTDDDLAEAANIARGSGNQVVKLTVCLKKRGTNLAEIPVALAAVGAAMFGLIAAITVIAMRPRK